MSRTMNSSEVALLSHDENQLITISVKNGISKCCAVNRLVIKLLETGRGRPIGHP